MPRTHYANHLNNVQQDVKKGNYFSLRRYLTPLQLFDPNDHREHHRLADAGSGEATREIIAEAVAASLSSLSADVNAMMKNDPTSALRWVGRPACLPMTAGREAGRSPNDGFGRRGWSIVSGSQR